MRGDREREHAAAATTAEATATAEAAVMGAEHRRRKQAALDAAAAAAAAAEAAAPTVKAAAAAVEAGAGLGGGGVGARRKERRLPGGERRRDVGKDVEPAMLVLVAAAELEAVRLPHARVHRAPHALGVVGAVEARDEPAHAMPLRLAPAVDEAAMARRQQEEERTDDGLPDLPASGRVEELRDASVRGLGHEAAQLDRRRRKPPRLRCRVVADEVHAEHVLLGAVLELFVHERVAERFDRGRREGRLADVGDLEAVKEKPLAEAGGRRLPRRAVDRHAEASAAHQATAHRRAGHVSHARRLGLRRRAQPAETRGKTQQRLGARLGRARRSGGAAARGGRADLQRVQQQQQCDERRHEHERGAAPLGRQQQLVQQYAARVDAREGVDPRRHACPGALIGRGLPCEGRIARPVARDALGDEPKGLVPPPAADGAPAALLRMPEGDEAQGAIRRNQRESEAIRSNLTCACPKETRPAGQAVQF